MKCMYKETKKNLEDKINKNKEIIKWYKGNLSSLNN